MQAFLFGFPWIFLDLFGSRYAQIATRWNGRPARLRSHRRRHLLPEAVRGLGLKSDRLERTRGGADQARVRGGAGAVGEAEIVLDPDPRMPAEQRRGGDAGGLAAAERADAPRVEPRHVRREERQQVARQPGAGQREPPEHVAERGPVEWDQ